MTYNTTYKACNKIREAIYQLVKEGVEGLRVIYQRLAYLREGKEKWGQ